MQCFGSNDAAIPFDFSFQPIRLFCIITVILNMDQKEMVTFYDHLKNIFAVEMVEKEADFWDII